MRKGAAEAAATSPASADSKKLSHIPETKRNLAYLPDLGTYSSLCSPSSARELAATVVLSLRGSLARRFSRCFVHPEQHLYRAGADRSPSRAAHVISVAARLQGEARGRGGVPRARTTQHTHTLTRASPPRRWCAGGCSARNSPSFLCPHPRIAYLAMRWPLTPPSGSAQTVAPVAALKYLLLVVARGRGEETGSSGLMCAGAARPGAVTGSCLPPISPPPAPLVENSPPRARGDIRTLGPRRHGRGRAASAAPANRRRLEGKLLLAPRPPSRRRRRGAKRVDGGQRAAAVAVKVERARARAGAANAQAAARRGALVGARRDNDSLAEAA
jgi:hypothetical protein